MGNFIVGGSLSGICGKLDLLHQKSLLIWDTKSHLTATNWAYGHHQIFLFFFLNRGQESGLFL